MTREFGSLAALAEHLAGPVIAELEHLHHALDKAAVAIEKTAKEEIGNYQEAIGPFDKWPLLKPDTEAEKERLGYPTDAPLYRTGEMQESIQHETEGLEAIIGSTDPTMIYHEFGTSKMEPRPVMGPALQHNIPRVLRLVGEGAVAALVGAREGESLAGYALEESAEE